MAAQPLEAVSRYMMFRPYASFAFRCVVPDGGLGSDGDVEQGQPRGLWTVIRTDVNTSPLHLVDAASA